MTPKILIVDDMLANLFVVEKLLTKQLNEKIEVLKANSGQEALDLAKENDISLVISDVQMPEMDGYELAKTLLSHEKTKIVPIILMTAASREDLDRFVGYQSGAIDYLDKPINAEILLTKVNILLSLYKAKKELEEAVYIKDLFLKQLSVNLTSDLNEITLITSQLLKNSTLSEEQTLKIENIYQYGQSAQCILDEALKISKLSAEEIRSDYEEITL